MKQLVFQHPLPLTWRQIKERIEARGVRDDDRVYLIDIGPGCKEIFVVIEGLGDYTSPPSKTKARLTGMRVVEIGDNPTLLLADAPEIGHEDRVRD